MNVRVLILGASGFLGRNFIAHWDKCGHHGFDVAVALRTMVPGIAIDGNKPLNVIWNADAENHEIIDFDPHILINLIGISHPRASIGNIMGEIIDGIAPLFRLLGVLKDRSLHTVIFPSSANELNRCFDEDEGHFFPENPYAAAKISIEAFLSAFSFESGVRTISLRITNPLGVDLVKDGFGAVNTFAYKVVRNEPVSLFGDADTYKDYIKVDDVSSAILASVNKSEQLPVRPLVFDVGSGYSLTAKSIKSIIEALHSGAIPSKSHLTKSMHIDLSRAKNILEWEPNGDIYSAIEEIYRTSKARAGNDE